jgi:hypothetical protein
MGTWGTGLFSNDMARDIRDFYRERIEDGIEDAEATRPGCEKVATIVQRPGDDQANFPSYGVAWSALWQSTGLTHS